MTTRFVTEQTAEEFDPPSSSALVRINPIDDYEFPDEIFQHAVKYHFLRVPLLGQHNPLNPADNWCARTSSTMMWNYFQLASGKINAAGDYAAHSRGPNHDVVMELREPSGDVIFPNYETVAKLTREYEVVEGNAKTAILKTDQ